MAGAQLDSEFNFIDWLSSFVLFFYDFFFFPSLTVDAQSPCNAAGSKNVPESFQTAVQGSQEVLKQGFSSGPLLPEKVTQ